MNVAHVTTKSVIERLLHFMPVRELEPLTQLFAEHMDWDIQAIPVKLHGWVKEQLSRRYVAAIAADPKVSRYNGHSLSSGELAKLYGFTDLDDSRPDCWRYITEVQKAINSG